MRQLGYRAVDALVERWTALAGDTPWKGGSHEEMSVGFGESPHPPEAGRPPGEVLDEALTQVLSRAGRVDHPRFMAFVPSAPTWPSVVADFLAGGFNVFQGTWLESAGPSRMELQVVDWFREWVGFPQGAQGVLTSGGSASNLLAIAMARILAEDPPRPVVYLPDQGHSSLSKACRISGIDVEGIRTLPTGPDRRLRPETVARAVDEDRAAGRHPLLLCANGGATNTGVVDPLPALSRLCREAGIRLHVDAAYGGFAMLDPEGATALEGLGDADSVTLDPHKWFFQPYECGALLVREEGALERAFRVTPEYLQDTELGRAQVNFADRGLQLTRSFRALKIWMSVQTFGMQAFREAVGVGIRRAREAEAWIVAHPRLELLSPASLGIVTYRYRGVMRSDAGSPDRSTLNAPGLDASSTDEPALDALNRSIQERIVAEGTAMISSTRLDERFALRLCILNPTTGPEMVEGVLRRVVELGDELQGAFG
ncbi:MAG: aminotransferase class I/II-fold pyridoxal phosphate-dependent enzyme [Gemmatimonadota bacterium]